MKLATLFLIGCSSVALAQLPPHPAPQVTRNGDTCNLDWTGQNSITYFVQYSLDLQSWSYMPVIESGDGSAIGYGFQCDTDKMFLRLHYTDAPTSNPNTDDFDGDGISNWDEVRVGGTGTSPLLADTNNDGIRDDGLVYAAQNDPDGVGLPVSLQSDILARWDFEQLNFNPPTFSFDDKTGNGWTASAYGVFQSPEGMVSKAAQIQNGYCAVDADVLQGKTNYSISFWINLTENSLKNAASNTLMGIYGLQDYIYYVDQFNDAYVDVDTNGLRVKKVGNTEEWNLGSYIYTNHANGVHGQTLVQETDTIRWTRALGTSDDGKWHHMVVVRNGNQYSVYFDNQLVASGSFAHSNIQFTSVSNLIFGRYFTQVGSPVASTSQMQGKFDRLSIYDKVLTAADVQNLYRQDIDSDGLFDITEHATAYWNDVNHNAIFESGEQEYAISPFYFHDANEDHDNDLASSLVEQSAGTNIADFDSDDDSIPDGWELNYGLNPLASFDANIDIDGDGYTASQEYAISDTDPNDPDTDDDNIGDKQDHPPRWVSITRSLGYDYDDYGPSQPNAPKRLITLASWPNAVATDENLSAIIPYNQLHTSLGQKQAFPAAFPNGGLGMSLKAEGEARTILNPPCYHAELDHKQVVVEVGAAINVAREFKALLVTKRTINQFEQTPIASEVVLTVPAGQTRSSAANVEPSFAGSGNTAYYEKVSQSLVPVNLITDMNNDGEIDSADNILRDAALATGASTEALSKGTEYVFVNDYISNGIADKQDPTVNGATEDDDAEAIKVELDIDFGTVRFDHPAIAKLEFYDSKECTNIIHFPFDLSVKPLPETIYLRTKDLSAGWQGQVEGNLVLKFKPSASASEIDLADLKLTVVESLGDSKFFQAARDYIFEKNSELFVHDKGFPEHSANPTVTIRMCCMREEATDMRPYELWEPAYDLWVARGRPGTFNPFDHREAAGIEEVMQVDDTMTVVINGNQCAFENGMTAVETLALLALGEFSITDRCRGRIGELNGGVSIVSSDHYDPSTIEAGTNMTGSYLSGPDPIPGSNPPLPGGKYVAQYGNGLYKIGAGRAPSTILDPNNNTGVSLSQTEMGGGSTNYQLNERDDYPNQMVGYYPGEEEGKGIIFTASGKGDDDKGKVVEFYNASKDSGVPPIAGATTPAGTLAPIQLIILDSGVTSVGLAHKNPDGDLNLIYKGHKHNGVPYFTNTFLRFKAQKPR